MDNFKRQLRELRKKEILRRKKYHWTIRLKMKKILHQAIKDFPNFEKD